MRALVLRAQAPLLQAGASLLAGLAYTTAAAPVDLVRSRLMAQPRASWPPGSAGGAGLAGLARGVVAAGGVAALWRGWAPATARLLPVVLLVFPLMEALRTLLGVGAY